MDIIRAIRLVDYYSMDGNLLQPSDASLPDWDELCFRITVAERFIDRYTGRSWRENRVKDEVFDINTYWHDENSRRYEYWIQGGYNVQLNRNVLPFDTSKGDRIEIRTLSNQWIDISPYYNLTTDMPLESLGCLDEPEHQPDRAHPNLRHTVPYGRFWIDNNQGLLFVRLGYFQPKQNALRITYRWGNVGEVPPDIKRATALKVGLTLLNEELYMTKIGMGGDLGSNKSDLKRAMQDEINEIIYANRTFTPMYSAYD
jgi:hypothetical protein